MKRTVIVTSPIERNTALMMKDMMTSACVGASRLRVAKGMSIVVIQDTDGTTVYDFESDVLSRHIAHDILEWIAQARRQGLVPNCTLGWYETVSTESNFREEDYYCLVLTL